MGKRRYPKAILPKKRYAPSINIDIISSELDLFIVRRADVNCSDILNEAGFLKSDVLAPREIPDLSVNLLGSFYIVDYINIKVINKGAAPWINNSRIFLSDFIDDYQVLDTCCPLIYKLNDLHNAPFPIRRASGRDSENFIKAFNLTAELIEKEYHFKGSISIVHSPTNLNYWHLELELRDANDNKIRRKDDGKWAKDAKIHVLEHFLSDPMLEVPIDMKTINASFFTKP